MVQVLKDEIFERIFQAAVDVFYEKDYRSAKMQEIAEKAGSPVSLIYNYYKNKEALFEKVVSSIRIDFEKIADQEEQAAGLPSEKYKRYAEDYILNLLDHYKIVVILMDKSQGTRHEHAKDHLIQTIEQHIRRQLEQKNACDGMLCHILATNFAEGILEVARHYKTREYARTLLSLLTQCYYEGVNSLL